MNELHLTTNPTNNPRVFDVYWMTGLLQKGRIRITVPGDITENGINRTLS